MTENNLTQGFSFYYKYISTVLPCSSFSSKLYFSNWPRSNSLYDTGLLQKKSTRWGWRYAISRGIKEIACGISRGSLKTKWNFKVWPRQNNVEFPGFFVFALGISKESCTILRNIPGLTFVLSGISRGKVKKWKIPGVLFKKVYPQPPCLE